MASTPTKKLKTETKSAIRAGFRDRGWTAGRDASPAFVAPDSLVAPPLSLAWRTNVDSYRYGGVTLTGLGTVTCDDVAEVLVDFDTSTLTPLIQRLDDRSRILRTLGRVAIIAEGDLIDPLGNYHQWIVDDSHPVDSVVAEFFAMVDGPLAAWAASNRTPSDVLRHYQVSADRRSLDALLARSLAVLALLDGDVELARRLVEDAPVGHGEEPSAVAGFERELAQRFPSYGALQRG